MPDRFSSLGSFWDVEPTPEPVLRGAFTQSLPAVPGADMQADAPSALDWLRPTIDDLTPMSLRGALSPDPEPAPPPKPFVPKYAPGYERSVFDFMNIKAPAAAEDRVPEAGSEREPDGILARAINDYLIKPVSTGLGETKKDFLQSNAWLWSNPFERGPAPEMAEMASWAGMETDPKLQLQRLITQGVRFFPAAFAALMGGAAVVASAPVSAPAGALAVAGGASLATGLETAIQVLGVNAEEAFKKYPDDPERATQEALEKTAFDGAFGALSGLIAVHNPFSNMLRNFLYQTFAAQPVVGVAGSRLRAGAFGDTSMPLGDEILNIVGSGVAMSAVGPLMPGPGDFAKGAAKVGDPWDLEWAKAPDGFYETDKSLDAIIPDEPDGGAPPAPQRHPAESFGVLQQRVKKRGPGPLASIYDVRMPTRTEINSASQATFTGRTVESADTMPLSDLIGGVRMTDTAEAARVRKLAAEIGSPGGYLERIIVDSAGNVIEGQHRLEALRQLGVKDVPVLRIQDVTEGLPVSNMVDAALRSGKIHRDHAKQIVDEIGEIVARGDNPADYDPPSGFEGAWAAALAAMAVMPGKGLQKPGSGLLSTDAPGPNAGEAIDATNHAFRIHPTGSQSSVGNVEPGAASRKWTPPQIQERGNVLATPMHVENALRERGLEIVGKENSKSQGSLSKYVHARDASGKLFKVRISDHNYLNPEYGADIRYGDAPSDIERKISKNLGLYDDIPTKDHVGDEARIWLSRLHPDPKDQTIDRLNAIKFAISRGEQTAKMKKWEEKNRDDDVEMKAKFQSPSKPAPTFFYKAEKVLDELKMTRGFADQWSATLKNKGVKTEEIEDLGIKEFLDESAAAKQPVSIDQIRQLISLNRADFKDVTYGDRRKDKIGWDDEAKEKFGDEWHEAVERSRQSQIRLSETDMSNDAAYASALAEHNANTEAQEALHTRGVEDVISRTGADVSPARFGTHAFPGGENYREMVVTLPPTKAKERIGQIDARLRTIEGNQTTLSDWQRTAAATSTEEAHRHGVGLAALNRERQVLSAERRMLFGQTYKSGHWPGQQNPVAHVRISTRTATDGKSALHIEELQSDIHNEGKAHGYNPSEKKLEAARQRHSDLKEQLRAANKRAGDLEIKAKDAFQDFNDSGSDGWAIYSREGENLWEGAASDVEAFAKASELGAAPRDVHRVRVGGDESVRLKWLEAAEARTSYERDVREPLLKEFWAADRDLDSYTSASVWSAPFKKSWHEMMLKKMIRYAAENGHDRIVWTPGEVQAERFGLDKHLSKLQYTQDGDGWLLSAEDKSGELLPGLDDTRVSDRDLDRYVGREMAERVRKKEGERDRMYGFYTLKGEGLKVENKGKRQFYDVMVPAFLKSYGKKFGATVGTSKVSLGKTGFVGWEYEGPNSTPAEIDAFMTGERFSALPESVRTQIKTFRQALATGYDNPARTLSKRAAEHLGGRIVEPETHNYMELPSFELTPELKRSVLEEGQPLYQRAKPGDGYGGPVSVTKQPLSAESKRKYGRFFKEMEAAINTAAPHARVLFVEKAYSRRPGGPREEQFGVFHPVRDGAPLIVIAMKAYDAGVPNKPNPDVGQTAWHEAYHVLDEYGFLKPWEKEAIWAHAKKKGWLKKHRIDERYPDASDQAKIKEAAADGLGKILSRRDFTTLPPTLAKMARRLSRMFLSIKKSFKKAFGADVTVDEILERIGSGEVGWRKTGSGDGAETMSQRAHWDTPEFKRWFSGSKVFEKGGAPLVVYHSGSFDQLSDTPNSPMHFGTKQAAEHRGSAKPVDDEMAAIKTYKADDGSWHWEDSTGATSEDRGLPGYPDEDIALGFGRSITRDEMENSTQDYDLPEPTAAYLSIKNPKRVKDQGAHWDEAIQQAVKEGYDGLVYTNEYEDKGSTSWVAFKPESIKSVENSGAYDPADKRIMFQSGERDAGPERQQTSEAGAEESGLPGPGVVRGGPRVLPSPDQGGYSTPLIGLPRKVTVPGHPDIFAGPYETAKRLAEAYTTKAGVKYSPIKTYKKVDVARAKRIAEAFDAMRHDPHDPDVRAAYRAMMDETVAQWQGIKQSGLQVEFIDIANGDPYAASPRLAIEDVKRNNHLWVFATDDGFGTEGVTAREMDDNPMLEFAPGEMIGGRPARVNDIFRIVHDYFGHIKDGVGFRADGEENAWRSHSTMYSDLARKAMTVETRGQNSWVNYGPHGDKNRTASTPDTVFAEQKMGLLPDWVMTEGLEDDPTLLPQPKTMFQRAHWETPEFKRWFGGSKAVDDDGSPKTLYHGTRTKGGVIDEFDLSKAGSKTDHGYMGRGFYFSDTAVANVYAGHYEFDPGHFAEGGAIYPVYLSIKNPVVLSDRIENGRRVDLEVLAREALGLSKSATSDEVRAAMLERGHDGAIYRTNNSGYAEYFVPNPSQIKTAISNTGTYDPSDGRIMFQSAGPKQKDLFDPAPGDTESVAFKNWFGTSKIKDGDKPRVMYHWTNADTDFDAFQRRQNDIGMHFGTKGQANDRGDYKEQFVGTGSGGRVLPVYLRIKNPLRVPDVGWFSYENLAGSIRSMVDRGSLPFEWKSKLVAIDAATKSPSSRLARLRDFMERKGYDGMVYKNEGEVGGADEIRKRLKAARKAAVDAQIRRGKKANFYDPEDQMQPEYLAWKLIEEEERNFRDANAEDSYITFRPEQVKSATGNRGTFDPKKKSILMQSAERAPRETPLQGFVQPSLFVHETRPGDVSSIAEHGLRASKPRGSAPSGVYLHSGFNQLDPAGDVPLIGVRRSAIGETEPDPMFPSWALIAKQKNISPNDLFVWNNKDDEWVPIKSATRNEGSNDGGDKSILAQRPTKVGKGDDEVSVNAHGLPDTREIVGRPAPAVNRVVGQIGRSLELATKAANGGRALNPARPADHARITKTALDEAANQYKQEDHGANWYDLVISEAYRLSSEIIPRLKYSEPARALMSAMTAIASNGNRAPSNWQFGLLMMEDYEKTGNIPTRNPRSGKIFGVKGNTIAFQLGALDRFLKMKMAEIEAEGVPSNQTVRERAEAAVGEWLMSYHTVKDLKEMQVKLGWKSGTVTGKLADSRIGAFIFGPKIGPFYLNINGVREATIDSWMVRQWGRLTGQLTSGGQLDAQGIRAQPNTPTERGLIVDMVNKVADSLGIKPQDAQALLWYYEQRLYRAMGAKSARSESFLDGAKKELAARGITADAERFPGDAQRGSPSEVPTSRLQRPRGLYAAPNVTAVARAELGGSSAQSAERGNRIGTPSGLWRDRDRKRKDTITQYLEESLPLNY